MRAKQFKLVLNYFIQLKGWIATGLLVFSFAGQTQVISLEEFNARIENEEKKEAQAFQQEWLSFLKQKSVRLSKVVEPSSAVRETENYLVSTGGLKKKLAEASRKNKFGFTFKRPADDPLRKASYHRAYNSIFVDLENVPAQKWLLRFIHEISHSLDSEMYASLKIYNDERFTERLEKLGEENVSLADLDPKTRRQLEDWLIAGLNRGLLGEYRAWLTTLLIYNEGLADGTFTERNPWLEEIKKSQPTGVDLQTHVFRYLSPSWIDPTQGYFQYPFIQQALKELRLKLFADPSQINMGQLDPILQLKK